MGTPVIYATLAKPLSKKVINSVRVRFLIQAVVRGHIIKPQGVYFLTFASFTTHPRNKSTVDLRLLSFSDKILSKVQFNSTLWYPGLFHKPVEIGTNTKVQIDNQPFSDEFQKKITPFQIIIWPEQGRYLKIQLSLYTVIEDH